MCDPRHFCGLLALILLFLQSPSDALGAPGLSAHLPSHRPLAHVEQYEVVYPMRVPVPRTRRDLSLPQALYPENIHYVLDGKRSNFTLHLRKNRDLMGANYTETYTLANGTEVTEHPEDLQDHCFYQGYVEGYQDSAASISTCRGVRGFFQTGSTVHLIEPLEDDSHEGGHAVYRAEHLTQKLVTCGVSNTTLEEDLDPKMAAAQKPRNWKLGAGPKETRFVELYVVVDHSEYMKFRSREVIRSRVKEIANHVDKLYQKLNFRVVLIGLEIWDRWDKVHISSDPDSTLDNFLKWTRQELTPRKKHDNAQLITNVDFKGTTVGLAKVASMCTENSGAVNQDHNSNPVGVASTMAHEMGHNLGMDHDENIPGCYCQEKSKRGCIMAASFSGTMFPQIFSTCSRNNLENFLGSNILQTKCLTNFPKLDEIYGGPVCGNKFVERGEECDCGVPQECTNHCCNATTCRLTAGATCAHGECCEGCQVVPAGRICREVQDDCDLPEYCDGQHGECPENMFKENGSPCQDGYCYNGMCPTYQQQCQALWGEGAWVAPDKCFQLDVTAGCAASLPSYHNFNKCGVLHCSGSMVTHRAYCTITLGSTKCTMAGKGRNEEFESVAPGTKCGEQRVCYDGYCQDLRVYGTGNCSSQCNGHGVCNHKRECHCHPGWAPPYCQRKVASASSGVLVGVLVAVFLLIILVILVLVLRKRQMLPPFQKRKNVTKTSTGLSNPLFQEGRGRAPGPFSAAAPAVQCPKPPTAPVVPRQPPPTVPPAAATPQAPFRVPVYTRQEPQQSKPVPPSKPLPELKLKQVIKPTSAPPPPPPIKPPAMIALKPQGAGPKVALLPPVQRR